MKNLKQRFDFDDILIIPKEKTTISSRYSGIILPKKLPLFTAPMDTVVDLKNIENFQSNGISVTLPRTIKYDQIINTDFDENTFISLGFDDIDFELKTDLKKFHLNSHILIDVANGHMEKIVEYCKKIKKLRPDIIIMVGNIANPETYCWYAINNCVDYIRVGIGNGNGCWVNETEILTKEGYKEIKYVEVGDFVLTHENIFEEVINKLSYVSNENLIKINGEICTESHEIYVVNKLDANLITDDNYLDYCYFLPANLVDNNTHLIVSLE